MPTDLDFANDLNLDATDVVQINNRLRACVHFLTKIDAQTTRIGDVLVPSSPPIQPETKAFIVSIASLSEKILGVSRRLNELPVSSGGLGDGG